MVEKALRHGGAFAELFCEQRAGFSLSIDESRVEGAQRGSDGGAGVRVVAGETTYFAHVDGLAEPDLLHAAEAASAAVRADRRDAEPLRARSAVALQEIDRRPGRGAGERKAELLRACDERARAAGDDVAQVLGLLLGGRGGGSRSPTPTASSPPTTGPGCGSASRSSPGARAGSRPASRPAAGTAASSCSTSGQAEAVAERAASAALTLLDADPAPAGAMPVVVGGGFGGVLFHEMTGHGLEADHVQKGASVYEGKLGERRRAVVSARLRRRAPARRVGHRRASTTRAPRLRRPRSSTRAGSPPTCTTSCGRARTASTSTGNGRRESFRHLPIPRMTNTFIAPGDAEARGADRRGRAGLLRGLVRRRPGRPDHGRLRLRRLGGLSDRGRQGDQPVPRRDPDRQLPRARCARSTASPTTSR